VMVDNVMTLERIAAEKRKVGGAARLRIESAGSYPETRIVAIEEDGTEHEILMVQRIEIVVEHNDARATITLAGVDFDVTARPVAALEERG
jgi:hypothetical protein